MKNCTKIYMNYISQIFSKFLQSQGQLVMKYREMTPCIVIKVLLLHSQY